jgi:membrane dipeptidase
MKHPVFDLHCDTPINIMKKKFNHIDPGRLSDQNYQGAIFAHWVPPDSRTPFLDAVKAISATRRFLRDLPGCRILTDPRRIAVDRLNIMLGIEGGHIFDLDFKQVEVLYDLGARVFTLVWNNSNRLCHSALEDDKKGLTGKGRQYLVNLSRYDDVLIDFSHASTRTVLDACALTRNRVFASHSCVRSLNPFLRNIDDAAIRAIVQCRGVVGVNFSRKHLGGLGVFEHIDYLFRTFGPGCPALGSDFDGIDDPVIPGPDSVQALAGEMAEKGYKSEQIGAVFRDNFLALLNR